MKQAVFDIETNGLFQECTKIWLLVIQDFDTKEIYVYGPEDKPIDEGVEHLQKYDAIVGHNIMMFDIPVIERFYPDFVRPKLIDTHIISKCQKYTRFNNRHSLEMYGEKFGLKKVKYDNWEEYEPEMRRRCIIDVKLNTGVYNYLRKELYKFPEKQRKNLVKYIRAEHDMSDFCAEACNRGWDFDEEKARVFLEELKTEMVGLEADIEPQMGFKVDWLDKEPREAKYRKSDGNLDHISCKYFEVDGETAHNDIEIVKGKYQRCKFIKRFLSSQKDVKNFLNTLNWQPDEWNYVKSNGKLKKTSPKLSESSLEKLGQIGVDISRYNSLTSRYAVVKTWLQKDLVNGKIHPDVFVIGTPSFRSTHKKIVNLPSRGEFGEKNRELFTIHDPDWELVGVDSKSNQHRGLCFLLGDEDYTKEVVSEDSHAKNRGRLDSFLDPETFQGSDDERRSIAKAFFYAYIFGAGNVKVANMITEGRNRNPKLGAMIKEEFTKSIPNLKKLKDKLGNFHASHGYIVGPHGIKIYSKSNHTLLCYLLQAVEKASMAYALQSWIEKLITYEIAYRPLIVYHDEVVLAVEKKNKDKAMELGLEAFHDGPKRMGINFMEGEALSGRTWYDVH